MKRKEKRLEAYRIAAARLDTLASENPDFEADISSVKGAVQSCVEAATEAQTMDVSLLKSSSSEATSYAGYSCSARRTG